MQIRQHAAGRHTVLPVYGDLLIHCQFSGLDLRKCLRHDVQLDHTGRYDGDIAVPCTGLPSHQIFIVASDFAGKCGKL